MTIKLLDGRNKIVILVVVCILIFLGCFYGRYLCEKCVYYYDIITDRELIESFVTSFGMWAPVVFIVIQILQVVFAPVPGEATGFIGGYLFGATKGFIYSTIGLACGSCINFSIGRILGKNYIRRLIFPDRLKRFDALIRRQGIVVIFLLFVFPGFPKDYLSLFLGMCSIPFKVFIILASVGRMPGTYILSLQGASLFEREYLLLALITLFCLLAAIIGYRFREDIYNWIEKS